MPDVKVFADNPASTPNIRMGDKMRVDQQNNMKTVLVGTGHGKKAADRDNSSILK